MVRKSLFDSINQWFLCNQYWGVESHYATIEICRLIDKHIDERVEYIYPSHTP